MKRKSILITAALFLVFGLGLFNNPLRAIAASNLSIGGWIPYWTVSAGTKDAKSHLKDLDLIYPFAFTIKSDGTLNDLAGLKDSAWKKLFKSAKKEGVAIIPSVMSSNGSQLHALLSNTELRNKHIDEIASVVKKGKYDGIDIDYEAKRAETRDYFSIFLKDLKKKLGSKTLVCTIEARTPPSSLYTNVPANIEYANDYAEIGKHCDIVQIMAYDQGRADIKLNASNIGMPYSPVSDVDWVRKVVELTVQSIPREKIMLSLPTYGREYSVTVAPQWFKSYERIRSVNPPVAVDLARKYKITPSRDGGGEMSFSYFEQNSPYAILSSLPVPAGTTESNKAAAQALMYANMSRQTVTVNYVVWSDSGAIDEKVKIAKEFKLRGIAIFKIDGGEDQQLWKYLK